MDLQASCLCHFDMYGKFPKISNTYCILFWPKFLFFVQLFLKVLSGMTNSADPDQTAPTLGLQGLHMPFCQELE